MKERIILAPGANNAELNKNLALHGVNCINLKIMSPGELARYALLKSGMPMTEEFLNSKEEVAVIAEAVEGEEYFGETSYSDIKHIAESIKRMRCLVADTEEEQALTNILEKGIFHEKNDALLNVYKKYIALLKANKTIDSVVLMRKAIANAKELEADFAIMKEYPLNPIEEELLRKVSGERSKEISILDLYQAKAKPLKIQSFKNCYGSPNEVETIIEDIYQNKKLDTCTVAVTDSSTYGQLFFDYALLHDIPITFGCGIPIINANPAKLLVLYYHWLTDGFFGATALNNILQSKAFNNKALESLFPEKVENFSYSKFREVLGALKLTNDKMTNASRLSAFKAAVAEEEELVNPENEKDYKEFIKKKLCIPYLEIMAEELSLPAENFIYKYSYIRRGSNTNAEKLLMQLDVSAASAIYGELNVLRQAGIEQTEDDIIPNILGMSVCHQRSKEGFLHITDLAQAVLTVRDNLYIAGLSAAKFPGSPKEDYLLLDEDFVLFGEKALRLTSSGKIARKKAVLNTLVHLASNLGSRVYVSFAGMNVSELKRENASSMFFELFRDESGKNVSYEELDKKLAKVDYFEPAVSNTREVGNAYNKGQKVLPDENAFQDEKTVIKVNGDLEREYSPSALSNFFSCPRMFMLKNLLGIQESQVSDPLEIISAADNGNLAHTLMEQIANSTMSKEKFIKLSEEYFARFLAQDTPIIKDSVEEIKNQFLEMMESAYDMDPRREVVLKEEDIHCQHESGVKLHGFPDRVEKLEDGTYLIVDFKSGNRINHVQDDIDTCLQVVIYAYLMEQKGLKVSRGEFRYLKHGESVTCVYNDEMKTKLNEKLTIFKEHMEKGKFPCVEASEENNACKFCDYGNVCGRY